MRFLFSIFSLILFYNHCFGQVHLGPAQTYPNLQSAVNANAIQAGDTVFLHTGSYAGYQGIANLNGNSTKWIVIMRYKNDLIDISGDWQFTSCKYIKLLHLNFKANSQYPGRLINIDNAGSCATQSKHIIIDSCSFSNVTELNSISSFKFGGVDSFIVSNNTFKDLPVCNAMDYNVCHSGHIYGNLIENCLSGGHIKGGASDITMERNLFKNASQDSWVAFELGGDTGAMYYCPEDSFEVKRLNFYSNIIVGGYRGIALSSARNCRVVNNTFYNCGQATLRFLTTSSLFPALSGNVVENNILAFGTSAYINGSMQPANAVSFNKNIYYSIINTIFNGPYWDTPDLNAVKDPNPIIYGSGTPIFKDGQNYDFNLITGSPAIGAGTFEQEPLTDFYGKAFSTTSRSIGAIETDINTGNKEIENNATANDLIIYPNPAKDYITIKTDNNSLVEILNLFGVKLIEANANQSIYIGHLASGIYLLKADNKVYQIVKL